MMADQESVLKAARVRRVNLGAGGRPMPGWTNLDRVGLDGIQVVHDLDVAPWPFGTGTVTSVMAKDVFEHVNDAVLFMCELYRVMAPGSLARIETTLFPHPDAFTDPTHKRFPTRDTFDYWIPGNVYHREHNAAYGGVSFDLIEHEFERGGQQVTLRKPHDAPH